jgi:hypothetical protein
MIEAKDLKSIILFGYLKDFMLLSLELDAVNRSQSRLPK